MPSRGARLLPFTLSLPLLLAACSQSEPTAEANPYAGGVSYPWSYTAPADRLTPLTLTPGENTLYYEPILAAKNGWGPIEIDRSNGEQGAGDGKALTLNGQTYARGFGVHADSELRYSLKGTGATCTQFTVDVGVDDEVGSRGSVVFQVYLDGVKAYDSGVMTGASATKRAQVDITGKQELRLVVTNGGDNIDYDHADWANPRVSCQAAQNQSLTMTLDPSTLEIFHKHSATVKATFSGSFNGPADLRLLVEPGRGTGLALRTTRVDLPASGSGTVTRDVVIDAPRLPSDLSPASESLTAPYRLIASQGGQDVASAPITITEKLLNVQASVSPSSVSGRLGETRRVTVRLQISPPLDAPLPISVIPSTQFELDNFTMIPVGQPYGDGGTMYQDFDLTAKTSLEPSPSEVFTSRFIIVASDFIGYRLPYYGGYLAEVVWNRQR